MASERIDDRYFEWLYGLFGSVRNANPARSYWEVSKVLYSTEFVWLIANDDNRVSDGLELRAQFLDEQGSDGADEEWSRLGCSVLEMLIALSQRASFESETEPAAWFGIFLQNLDLVEFRDDRWTKANQSIVEEILERFVYRNYHPDGTGGLFPLNSPPEDQRRVELWYQLASYLSEQARL